MTQSTDESPHPPSLLTTLAVCLVLILLTGAAAWAGAIVSMPGSWYASLDKPPLTPPSAVFGPVWTVLYVMMAIAACRAWYFGTQHGLHVATPLALYVAQLGLNAGWSWLFFEYHRIDLALYDILALWVLIVATSVAFSRLAWSAGLLLLPYLLWVSFATYLNLGFWRLNPQ